jgi:hypothetical protein
MGCCSSTRPKDENKTNTKTTNLGNPIFPKLLDLAGKDRKAHIVTHILLTTLITLSILIFFFGVYFYNLVGYFGPVSLVVRFFLMIFGFVGFIVVVIVWACFGLRFRCLVAGREDILGDPEKGTIVINPDGTRQALHPPIVPTSASAAPAVSAVNEANAPTDGTLEGDNNQDNSDSAHDPHWARDWSSANSSRIWAGRQN